MKPIQVAALRRLAALQKERDGKKAFDLMSFLFKEQYDFVTDRSPNKIAMCSRRAGKTVSCAADLINTAINSSGVTCLYITLSRNNAKKIVWRDLQKINQEYDLKGTENLSELSIRFLNGSIIYLSGAKDKSEIEKFRGLALKLVYIDEAQSFRSYIKELIDDVISPALMDYAGTLCLIGTPPPVLTGYFHDSFKDRENSWSKHAWTFFNNPFVVEKSGMSHREMLQRELQRRGTTEHDPSIQREYFGALVSDKSSLLIKYDETRNHFEDFEAHLGWTYVMGIDIGHKDADALAVLAWNEYSPNIYLVDEYVKAGQDITELMQSIDTLRRRYDISKMLIDTGGLGKKITEELIRRYHLPLEPADKARKMENIALLNTYLQTSKFKAHRKSLFAEDSKLVQIDRDRSTPDKIVVSDAYHSDIIDAVLYAFKACYAYTYQEPPPKPVYGTKAWAEMEEDKMFQAELESLQKKFSDEEGNNLAVNDDPYEQF